MKPEEDEVDKAEAPVGKEKTEDSKQSTPLKKPIPKDEDLPTSAVPNKEPNVLDTREEEECEADPKEEDVDESNGEGNETQTAESKDVSNTSEQNMAFTGSIHDDNCDTGDQVISSKKKLEKHMAKKHKRKRKYTGEFRERSFKEQETLRLHFRQDHEDEYDDEEHDAEDAEVVEGLGDEKAKDKHMDNKLSSHLSLIHI